MKAAQHILCVLFALLVFLAKCAAPSPFLKILGMFRDLFRPRVPDTDTSEDELGQF